ncbi:MAG: TonB-dependent receptor [Gemmatimonadetes bacterium]|nr:TonB-dependent receptor [Gemmatimonadota bacterium]
MRSNLRSTLSFGVQGVENTEETVWATGSELPGPGDYTISSASMRDSYQTKIRVITGGLFVQDMLALSDRYFLTLGLRVDGNSAFGSGFGLQPYPKASFSYVISDEAFWPEMLGSVKLRAAYGFAGRAPGAFDAVRTWEPIGWGTDRPAFQPQNLGNEDLGPERTRELELGFDASVLSNRVNAEVTYYTRTTADALFGVRRPATSGGWDNQLENVGEFKNWGTEATVNATILNSPSLRWDLGVGITTTKSEVISLGGSPPQSNLREGLPVPVIRGSKIMNFWEKADPIVQSDQVYGPSYPTHMYNLTTSIGLPGGIALSGRGEYQGGFYISNGAESNALSRGISSPKCYNAYRLQEAGRRADMYAWERQQCFGMSPGTNIVPGDFFELRDVTLSIPLSSLVPSLTSWSSRTDLTVSARNVWYKTSKELVYGHPEQESRTGIGSPGFNLSRSIGETIPPQSFFTVSLRTVF